MIDACLKGAIPFMYAFFTSCPLTETTDTFYPANGFLDRLNQVLPKRVSLLYVCSNPDGHAETDYYFAGQIRALEKAGFTLDSAVVLDGRNASDAGRLVASVNLIVLAGGHVPTQNAFFYRIHLRELLKSFDGVLIGISAGSMNSAAEVYAQPEAAGESISPDYVRFLPGLDLTNESILPHYQLTRNALLDGKRLFEDITYPDSMGRRFLVLPDGSYLFSQNDCQTLCGEAYRLADGVLTKICEDGASISL